MKRSNQQSLTSPGAVRVGTIAAIPGVIAQLGCEPATVLERTGFDISLFDNPDNVIPDTTRSQLIELCARETRCPHFGLLVGQCTELSALGLVGFLVQHAPDVEKALRLLVRYAHLHVCGGLICFDTKDDAAFLGYSVYSPNIEGREQINDSVNAIAFNIMRRLAGPEWKPMHVHFAHRKPADVLPYRRFFKAPLKFDAERNGVFFSREWLQQPIPGAEPELRRLLQQQLDQLSGQPGESFVDQVQRVLHSMLLTQQTTADNIAAQFSMHPRTLHRRLKHHGAGFQQLVDQTRFAIARQSLEDSSMKIIHIAAMLQYADISAFTRAFRRWSGMSPARWRKRHGYLQS